MQAKRSHKWRWHNKMSDFSQKMTDILNYGALNLAMAIGYKNRIFDILEDLKKPATISEIAAASGLNRRYLKEWLGIMVTGEIMELFKTPERSEERRVGKECRSRWSPYH